jgi:integrase/recombinase XerD
MRNACSGTSPPSTERGQTHVHAHTAIDWAARGPSVAQRDARMKAVCRFARHVRVEDARHELPSVNHFGARKTRRPPHIYSAAEVDQLIEAHVLPQCRAAASGEFSVLRAE